MFQSPFQAEFIPLYLLTALIGLAVGWLSYHLGGRR